MGENAAIGETPNELRVWALHLLAFVFPVTVSAYLLSGPHEGLYALAWVLIPLGMVLADHRAPPERRQPVNLPEHWFDVQLYLLAGLQVANVAGFVVSVAQVGLFSAHALVGVVLVGLNSGYSGIVVAHELVHRASPVMRFLARVLMTSVGYEHFTTEHVRGHHARVATAADGATAVYGEKFYVFFRRTVPAQFRSAWRLETKRLGDVDMPLFDRRQLRNRVLHGLLATIGVVASVAIGLGGGAAVAFAAQGFLAVLMLEAVNWFEHWGLTRAGSRPSTVDSWDAESWLTLYSLVGLSRHADHHAHAARPYAQLRSFDESPKLPSGYLFLAITAVIDDRWIRKELSAELARRQLGPYRTEAA